MITLQQVFRESFAAYARSRRLPLHAQVHWEALDGSQMEGRKGRLVNLSSGGCCVEGVALPSAGTQVLLTTEPEGERGALRLLGRVRWTERPEGGFMGVEFVGTAPGVSELLSSLGLSTPR